MEEEKCENCVYFLEVEESSYDGVCRRRPPKIVVQTAEGEDETGSYFPDTQKNWWCGEYSRK